MRVVLTGAAGRIGRVLRRGLRADVDELRLVDRAPVDVEADVESVHRVDLTGVDAAEALVEGADAVVHLAALPSESPFPDILHNNIAATYSVLEAARRTGVARVVLASSNHATGMYPRDQRIGPAHQVRPDTFYGVGKVCDEALGRLYADKWGLAVTCLRIGTFAAAPSDERSLSTWLSHHDGVALVRAALQAAPPAFTVLYGVSANTRAWWDNPAAPALGYHPVDDAERFAWQVDPEPDDGRRRFQGGEFALPSASAFDPPAVAGRDALDRIGEVGVLPVVSLADAGAAEPLRRALVDADMRIAEVTLRDAAAVAVLQVLAADARLLVGAGTVLRPEQVDAVVDAGARFVVSPGFDEAVVRRCRARGVPVIPGVATATEIGRALAAGIDVLKLFPAGPLGGPAAVRALAAPFPTVRFVPTGGVGPDDLGDYLDNPAVLAVGGSWLVAADLLAAGRWDEVRRRCADAVARVAQVRT